MLARTPKNELSDFDRLIAQRSGRWYQACLRITADAGLAEDAVQDALLKAWHRRDQFRAGSELDTWVHRIAINAALDLMRRDRSRFRNSESPEPSAPQAPADERRRQEFGRDLGSALNQLTEVERVCFVLKHLEQWRLEEIAEQQSSTLGSVKQALFRALKKLRISMEPWRSEA